MSLNMWLRRLTSLALILSIISVIAFAEAEVKTEPDEDVLSSVELLEILNIIKDDDNFESDAELTRGYFAALVCRALLIDGSGEDIRTMFRDVSPDYKWADEIAGMYRMGHIQGHADRKFYPEDKITYYDAVTILVNSLGYRQHAEARGGYPIGYVAEAKRLKIGADKSGNEILTQGDGAKLTVDMLEADAVATSGVENGNVVYTVSGNLLSRLHDVYTADGIVSENGITGLDSASADENSICVDGIRLQNTTGEDLSWLLGMSAEIYYRDNNGSYEYLTVKNTDDNIVCEMTGWEDSPAYDRNSNSIVGYIDNKKKQFRLSREFKFIYNGKAEENYLKYIANLVDSKVKIIDNDSDGVYDTVIVERYSVLVADAVNTETETIIDKYTPSESLKLEDYEMVYFTDMSGSAKSVGDIRSGDVLSYFASADKSYIRIIKSSLRVSGKVTAAAAEDDVYVIDGKEYRAAQTVKSGVVRIETGKSGEFDLDIFGRIAAFTEEKNNGINFGLLVGFNGESVPEETVYVKMLTEYRDIRVYKLAEKVKIDGTQYKTNIYNIIAEKAAQNDGSNWLEEDVVRYGTNDDGEINMLEFALPEPPAKKNAEEGRLYVYKTNVGNGQGKATRFYKSDSGNFNDEFIIDKSQTIIFGIDDNFPYGNYDRYFTATGSIFKNDKTYRVAAYTTKKEPDKAEVVVYHGVKSAEMKFFAINTLYTTINEDGDIVYKAQGFSRDADSEIMITDTVVEKYNLEAGDIIGTCKTNLQDAVYDCTLVYDYSENKVLENKWNGLMYDERQYMIYPYSCSGSIIKWAKAATREEAETILSDKDITENDLNQVLAPASRIYVRTRDGRGDIYRKGTMADIVSYSNDPDNYTDIMVYSLWGNLKLIIVFE